VLRKLLQVEQLADGTSPPGQQDLVQRILTFERYVTKTLANSPSRERAFGQHKRKE
jgi:hypothetical protein